MNENKFTYQSGAITTAQTFGLCNRTTCCCGRQKFGIFT